MAGAPESLLLPRQDAGGWMPDDTGVVLVNESCMRHVAGIMNGTMGELLETFGLFEKGIFCRISNDRVIHC